MPAARTQRERTETTQAALLTAARELFAADGYAATSLDAVVARAGVTKGALYHHYESKRDLFRAVFVAEQEQITHAIAAAYTRKRDPWDGFEAGAKAFLEITARSDVQRLTLLDAPGALGWETVRELEAGSMALLQQGLRAAMDAGRLRRRPVEPLASLLFGALCEAAMSIARAPDEARARRAMVAELRRLLGALAAG